jgi:hypothetical protein
VCAPDHPRATAPGVSPLLGSRCLNCLRACTRPRSLQCTNSPERERMVGCIQPVAMDTRHRVGCPSPGLPPKTVSAAANVKAVQRVLGHAKAERRGSVGAAIITTVAPGRALQGRERRRRSSGPCQLQWGRSDSGSRSRHDRLLSPRRDGVTPGSRTQCDTSHPVRYITSGARH